MSVKLMTPKQIRDDLKTILLTWPEGVPWQQIDRINALKGELKRRGEPLEAPAEEPVNREDEAPLTLMPDEALEARLRALSERVGRDPKDEAAQQRFADVRFELRKRAKLNGGETTRPSLPPRELELPPDDEVPTVNFDRMLNSSKENIMQRVAVRGPVPVPTLASAIASDAPSTIPADPPKNLVERVGEQLLVRALREIDAGQYNEVATLVHTFAALRGSIRDKPYSP